MRVARIWLAGVVAVAGLAAAASASDYHLEKKFDLAAGGSFSLRASAGSVEVRGGSGAQAVVVIDSTREDFAEHYDVRFDANGSDRVDVTVERRSHLFQWSWSGRTTIRVELPHDVSAEVHSSGGRVEISNLGGKVRAESSGGSVHIADVGGDVVLSSSGGSVEVRGVDGAARVHSSGGSVTLEDVGGDIDADSSGGGVRIDNARGEVTAGSSGGPVRVSFAAGNSKGGSLSSSGGGVHVWLDPAVGLDVDASSSGGGVSCDLPITIRGRIARDRLTGQLNGGGATLRLRSSGGGISIEQR